MAGRGHKVLPLSEVAPQDARGGDGGRADVVIVLSSSDSNGLSKIRLLKGRRGLLAAWSPVLRASLAEAEAAGHAGWIQVSGVEAAALEGLLAALQKGELAIDWRSVWPTRRVSQRLAIQPLVDLCDDYVLESLDTENCVPWLAEASRCGAGALEAAARDVAVASFQTIRKGEDCLGLDCDQFLSILEAARDRHALSDFSVLCSAMQWVEHDQEARREACPGMLSKLQPRVPDGKPGMNDPTGQSHIRQVLAAANHAASQQLGEQKDTEAGGDREDDARAPPGGVLSVADSLYGLEGSRVQIAAIEKILDKVGLGSADLDEGESSGIMAATGSGAPLAGIREGPEGSAAESSSYRGGVLSSGSGTIEFTPAWPDDGPEAGDGDNADDASDASEVPGDIAPQARGILTDVEIGDLKELGWRVVYGKPCGQATSAGDLERLPGDYLLVGVALRGESTLRLAAMGRRDRVLARTAPGETNAVNGAHWHLRPGESFGFSGSPGTGGAGRGTTVEVRGRRLEWALSEGASTPSGFTSPRGWAKGRGGREENCERKWLKLVFSWSHAFGGEFQHRGPQQE